MFIIHVGYNEKENVSVLVTSNADGDVAQTFVLFTGKNLPENAAAFAPPDFIFGCADNGYMTASNFYEYIANAFEPWLTEKKIERPVILYLDGHASHLTLPLSTFCAEHKIILIALHPNATHVLQPLDVSYFKTLKAEWFKINSSFCEETLSFGIKKHQLAPLLNKTMKTLNNKKLMINGFKRCGLFPFDVEAVDF